MITLPHTFHDGTGETASGAQVMDNFNEVAANVLQLVAEGTVGVAFGSSSIAGGATEKQIAHTLGRIPKAILLTPFQGAGTTAIFLKVTAETIDATHFTAVANVSQGTAQPFYWVAIG